MINLISHNAKQQKASGAVVQAYNLFRRKEAPELVCAVPEDRAVPRFIAGESWEFSGRISAGSREHAGFDGHAASTAARYNGFYLFHSLRQFESG
jgi:hypothetical protein